MHHGVCLNLESCNIGNIIQNNSKMHGSDGFSG